MNEAQEALDERPWKKRRAAAGRPARFWTSVVLVFLGVVCWGAPGLWGIEEEALPDAPIPWADEEAFGIATDSRLAELRSLPVFRIFDAKGRLIYDFAGFPSNFEESVGKFLAEPSRSFARARSDWDLASELGGVVLSGEEEAGPRQEVDLTLVKYWADWCAPCRLQTAALGRVLKKYSEPRVLLVHVEADLFRRFPRRPQAEPETGEATEPET